VTTAATPRGVYRKSTRRREEILDAAFEVFARVGYLNASVTEIAKMAGFTLPGLSHHYPSKAALFEAVVHRRDLDAQSHLVNRTGIDLLRGLVEIAQRDEVDRRSTRLFAIISAEASDPAHPMHGYFRDRYDLIIGNVTGALRAAEEAGHLRRGVDPGEGARRYVALSDGLQVQAMYDETRTQQTDMLRRALEEMLVVSLSVG
jgi:AcrR family transcriptional regulator